MVTIILLLLFLLKAYFWIRIAEVMVSWLIVFNVINTRNKWVYMICDMLNRLTRPVMNQVRRVIPPIGGIDLSPMVIIFGIILLQRLLVSLLVAV
jgi:YggT family protein